MSLDNFYRRKVPFFKYLKLIDSDNDGVKDTFALMPQSNTFFIQLGLNQNLDDLGIYDRAENDDFEIIDFNGFWDTSNDGLEDGYPPDNFTGFTDLTYGDQSGSTIGSYGCMDVNSPYYDPQATDGCPPVYDSGGTIVGITDCCNSQIDPFGGAGFGDPASSPSPNPLYKCLVFYTDWGPWNDDLILNDTHQIFNLKANCEYTIRLINQASLKQYSSWSNKYQGGWYGDSLQIEISYDGGITYTTITPTSPEIIFQHGGVDFGTTNIRTSSFPVNIPNRWSLNQNIGYFTAKYNPSNEYFITSPYSDITILPQQFGAKLKLTYYQYGSGDSTVFNIGRKLRYQVIRGLDIMQPNSRPLEALEVSPSSTWAWLGSFSQNYLPATSANNYVLTPFHGPFNSESSAISNINKYFDINSTQPIVDKSNNSYPVSDFYYDISSTETREIIYDTNPNPSSAPNQKIDDVIPVEQELNCLVENNPVSYYDRDGDGIVETLQNYPTIGPNEVASVDTGLYSKTRYDSPYIFIKPGTTDGTNLIATPENDLIEVIDPNGGSNVWEGYFAGPLSKPSSAGWKKYGYYTAGNPRFKLVTPTCQLGGSDNQYNAYLYDTDNDTFPDLTDISNSNLFLPQSDVTPSSSTYGNNKPVVLFFNTTFDTKGSCCSKSGTFVGSDVSSQGPWLDGCETCHEIMTNRSAQPVLDAQVRVAMQTTDSGVYYGPFYDPNNPTYNGYGLAFAKATNFCRQVLQKNGVDTSTTNTTFESGQGVLNFEEVGTISERKKLMGGIIAGGAQQNNPNTNINSSYGVTQNGSAWENCGGKYKPLKCKKAASNDPNCPSGNCMKCVFCFFCTEQAILPGVFTGSGSVNPTGSTNPPIGGLGL
jgi:hypothetical protein